MSDAKFVSASGYQDNVLGLPVKDLDASSAWYTKHFGLQEVERSQSPDPQVVMERDGIRIGFALNGGDPEQDGAAIKVENVAGMREDLESRGTSTGNWRVDERDGKKFQVFFVVAPDGLCYYFYEELLDS